jgi:hypothetical protein
MEEEVAEMQPLLFLTADYTDKIPDCADGKAITDFTD